MSNLLKTHLLCEFVFGPPYTTPPLNETRGYYDGLKPIIDGILKTVAPQVRWSVFQKQNTSKDYIITHKDLSLLSDDVFFDELRLTLRILTDAKEGESDGEYDFKKTLIQRDSYGGVVCKPVIVITAVGDSVMRICVSLSTALAHELTHAYSEYRHFLSRGERVRLPTSYSAARAVINVHDEAFIRRFIGVSTYCLFGMEKAAMVAQVYNELMPYAHEIHDGESAEKAIRKTQSFKRFYLVLQRNLKIFEDYPFDEEQSRIIVDAARFATRKKFNTYADVRTYYIPRLKRWLHDYIIKVSKIAHDISIANGYDVMD